MSKVQYWHSNHQYIDGEVRHKLCKKAQLIGSVVHSFNFALDPDQDPDPQK